MNREEKIGRIKKIVSRVNSFCGDNGFVQYNNIEIFGINDFKLFSFDKCHYDKNKPTNGNLLEIDVAWYFTPDLVDNGNIDFIDPDKCFLEINIHSDKFQQDFEQMYEGLECCENHKESRAMYRFYPTKGDEENLNEVLVKIVEKINKFQQKLN